MYVHEAKRLVYLAHPKTASRAVRDALKQHGFVRSIYLPNSRPHKCGTERGPNHHKGLREHPGPEWTVFAAVRNHFDAWVSWYAYTGRDGERFDPGFVERIMERNSTYFPEPDKMWALHTRFADRVLRYETQAADLSNLLGEQVVLPLEGVSEKRERRPYQEFYTPEMRAYVLDRFGDEIAAYGYKWEGEPLRRTPPRIVHGVITGEEDV